MQDEAHRLAERLAALGRAQRLPLLRRLAAEGVQASTLPIVPFRRDEPLPASHAQRGLWLTWRQAPHSAAYNMAGALVLRGTLDVSALSEAVRDLAQRHEVLRTVYRLDADGELQQVVQAGGETNGEMPDASPLIEEDLSPLPSAERESAARDRVRHHAGQAFDLENGPVWRVALLRLDSRAHWLVIAVHHIAADGWSESVLVQDLAALYEARASRREAALPPLPIQFADHAAWQQEWSAAGELERQLAHWRQRLASLPALPLPLDRPRPARRADAGARHAFALPDEVASGLRRLAQAHGCTVFMVMLALLKLTLARTCATNDISIGTPIAQRGRAETHGLVGYLTNVLVLRTTLDLQADIGAALAAVRETVLDAQAHADCPFDLLVSTLAGERVAGLHPLFQVKCAEQHDTQGLDRFGALDVTPLAIGTVQAHFDLSFDFTARAQEIACEFVFAVDVFDAGTVGRMAQLLVSLASQVVRAPAQPLSDLLPASQPSRMLGEFALRAAADDIIACWERSVAADGRALAVQCEHHAWTREELDGKASALAAELQARGVGPEVRVGVHAARSAELVLGLLAVLKAGGVYVPLDPALPAERLAYQAQDSGMALLLSAGEPSWPSPVPVLGLDRPAHAPACRGPAGAVHPRQTAYLIYTSGSTGRPKGVAVERGALANYVQGVLKRMDLPGDATRMAMVSTVAADLGHTVLFGALCAGPSLHLLPAASAFDPDAFADHMRRYEVDVLKIVPSHLQALLQAARPADVLPRRLLILGGEATRWDLLDRIAALKPGLRVLNHYGPTETTVGILTQEAGQALRTAVALPIGRPLPNSGAHVLDARLDPVPQGAVGELYLAGDGLARGYEGRAAHTAERFIASPFDEGRRLYRTGDRVRLLADGSLEFLGRLDDQVKVRGHRVELGEVAQALRMVQGVRLADVVAREGSDGRIRLVAYVVPEPGASLRMADVQARLAATLPDPMVPSQIVELASLPLNANGKVDRQALPDPPSSEERRLDPPQGDTEQALADIWCEVLGLEAVGRGDNFFRLGGDSILSLKVMARARKRGVAVSPRQLFECRDLAALARSVAGDAPPAALPPMPLLDAQRRRGPVPASHAQARQWFLWQLDPQGSAYHIAAALRLRGPLDVAALQASLEALVARHEALRTVFQADASGEVQQLIREESGTDLPLIDLSALPSMQREEAARQHAHRLNGTPFDLATGPLLRAALLRLAAQEHLLVVVMHHIVSDGASMQIIVDEFSALYRARTGGAPFAPPPLPIQYADYAAWHRDWLRGGEAQRQLRYWTERLGADHPVLQLPTDHARRADGRYRLGLHAVPLPGDLVPALQRRASAEGATVFMLLLAAWQALLHRHSGQADIRVGVPVANRQRPETEQVVGLFVNTQVLRSVVDARMSLAELLAQVRQSVLDAQAHQDLPFEQLVEALQPERRLGQSPLFQVMHNHQREDDRALRQWPGLVLEPHALDEQEAQAELALHSTERPGERLEIGFAHALELFEPHSMARMASHYLALLRALAEQPGQALGDVALLGAQEWEALRRWGTNAARHADAPPVHRMVSQQARRTPDATAIVCGADAVSYAQLERQANRLAHALIAHGAAPETRLGLVLDRRIEMVVALLAVMKTGAAYVPLDPEQPAERLAYMAADSGITLLLTHGALRARVPALDVPVLQMDALPLAQWPDHDPDVPAHGEQLAYAIYTSGSTGRPKSVMVRQRALSHFLLGMRDAPGLSADDVLVAVTSLTFDIAALEIYLPLMVGARLVLARRETVRDGAALTRLLHDSGATALQCTPAGWRMLRAGGWPLAPVRGFKGLCGGEALQADLAQDLHGLGVALWNMYGPTETTVWSAATRVEPVLPGLPGIAGPIADTRLHVLDAGLQAVPPNVPGELFIGGVGLARGYHGRPGLSAERFVADPFEHGARLYRTGDLVRWRSDGQLEFLGRIDHQVKIRGWRIELGEIESQLLAHAAVAQAVAVARDGHGGPRLVAYVAATPPGPLDTAGLKEHLGRRLPDYMLPSLIVQLQALPLNANGKVDRQALPEPQASEQAHEPPQGDMETALAGFWAELLGAPRIGRHDHFFELGGHSLLATQLVSRIRQSLQRELPLRRVFERPVLRELAQALQSEAAVAVQRPAAPAAQAGRMPLSHAQQRLWFLWKLDPRSAAFNIPVAFHLRGRLDHPALCRAFQLLVSRHAVLRTVFHEDGGEGWQEVLPAGDFAVATVDVAPGDDASVAGLIDRTVREPFDLARGPLLRAHVLRLSEEQHVLVVVMHHIVADGWSLGLLMNEFAQAYAALAEGHAPRLPALPTQYADAALAQHQHLQGAVLERLLAYWKATLAGVPPLVLPADQPVPAHRTYPGGMVALSLDASTTHALRRLAQDQGATLFMLLLAAFSVVASQRSGQSSFHVGTDMANRHQADTEPLVGFFVNQVPLRMDVSVSHSLPELLSQLRETVVEAAGHQALPFDRLVDAVRTGRRDARAPLFQVKVIYQEDFTLRAELPGLVVEDLPLGPKDAELDLIVGFVAAKDHLALNIKYDREVHGDDGMQSLGAEITAVLHACIEQPGAPIDTLRAVAARTQRAAASQQADERASQLARWRGGLKPRTRTAPSQA